MDFSPRGSYQLWVVSTTKQNIMEEYIKHIDENIIYDGKTIVLGIPFDDRSSYLKGAAKGPEAIRKALNSSSGNLATESGYNLGSSDGWHDMGNIDDMQSNNNAFSIIEGRLNEYLNQGARIVTLGGDHSITLPIIRAYGKNIRPLVLIFLCVSTVLLIFIDAGVISFEVKASWVDLLQLVLITVIGAYFGGRSLEKVKK